MIDRVDFFKIVQANIEKDEYHITIVNGIDLPRFAYTIGCKEIFGAEIIFAGGEYYSKDSVVTIIQQTVEELKKGLGKQTFYIKIDSLGSFSLSEVDRSWSELVALGVFDYYNQSVINFLQILPDKEHNTIDVPNMSEKFDVGSQQIWQWLVREWDYPVPRNSTAVTNLKVLYGEKSTEVMRWETDEWEVFSGAGPDVPKEEIRIVPLGVLLGSDKSLEPVVHLEVGKGLWRDPIDLVWNQWE
ncbi:DUF4262 domain-containing protein [Rufibacter quisquiliarum]|uniref:Uncharacterized protein n=1 Tax=Rufibacter quisquiliarum TaxID=1549639 RepID=A0A839GQE0_9BACT|nr:DUF4262 domain-containing protein [Rufibacter quisquiliarum]MBA9077096.1 hypothetical protein [Rufibacter quisquiliarum]